MWKYQNTDEMFTNNNSELYHSDVYLGKDFSDGIKHWKYIKRENVNGRWRYYYKDDKLNSTKKQMDKAYDDYNSYFDKNKHKDLSGMAKMAKQDKALSTYTNKQNTYNRLKRKSDKRQAKYEKYLINPMNKVSDKVYSGKQKVSNAINNIKNNIKKKTFSIKQNFKKKQKA